MLRLHELLDALRERLAAKFRTVRISSLQTSEQFLRELKTVNPDRLPAVVIVFDGIDFDSTSVCTETRLSLVLVDAFRANADDRAVSLFRAADTLLELFPPLGMSIDEVFIHPVDVQAASVDPLFAALALGIVCKQRLPRVRA